jgi:predicted nucleic acid-binding protein
MAADAINTFDCFISTQTLNEFSNVALRKIGLTIQDTEEYLDDMEDACTLLTVSSSTVRYALELHGRYSFSYFDSLMLASALQAKCNLFLSEDMADGMVIEDTLTIKNIFT